MSKLSESEDQGLHYSAVTIVCGVFLDDYNKGAYLTFKSYLS